MKNDAFERQLKNLFEHEEVALNTEELWSNIEDRVEGKKKKRRFFFWLFFGAGLLALGTYLLWPQSTSTDELLANDDSSVIEIPRQQYNKVEAGEDRGEISDAAPVVAAKEEILVKKAERSTEGLKQKAAITEKGIIIPPSSKELAPPDQQSAVKGLELGKREEDKGEIQVINELSFLSTLSIRALDGPPIKPDFKMLLYKKFKRSKAKDKKRKNRKIKPRKLWTHAVDLYAGPDVPIRHIKGRNDFFGETLRRYRKDDEKSLGGYHLGFQYKLYHNRGWMLVGGLEYRQVNERFRLFEENEEILTINGVVSVVVNSFQDTIRQNFGDKLITRITTRERLAYNRYRSLNATLGTGYRNQLGKWRIEWVGGLDFNLSASMKGTLRNAAGTVIRVDTKSGFSGILNQDIYRSKIGMGIWASASFARTFGNGMTLFATPYLRQQLGSLTSVDYELEHRHTTLGLKLGGRVFITRSKKKK